MSEATPKVIVVWLWTEDDAPVPDKERVAEAFKRITGRTVSCRTGDKIEDHGDCMLYLEKSGRYIIQHSCDGSRIGKIVSLQERGYYSNWEDVSHLVDRPSVREPFTRKQQEQEQ